MQVTEVSVDGLRHAYKVVVPAAEIEERITTRLKGLAQRVRVPGFRPGKAPVHLLKVQYGKAVLDEVLGQAIEEGSTKAIAENALKPALQPRIDRKPFDEGQDFEFELDVEVLPEMPEVDVSGIELVRETVAIDEPEVDEAIRRLAERRQTFAALEEVRPAQAGDRVTLDFLGKLDGEPFDGGKAEDFKLVLGTNTFIPGFEDQVIGMEAGAEKVIEVTFPEDYGAEHLKGRAATFDVRVKAIEAPGALEIDDALAKDLGAENLEGLRTSVRERLGAQYGSIAREKMKRALLDKLAEAHSFKVPPGLVNLEFDLIWRQLEDEIARSGKTLETIDEDVEELRAEYRGIAERRVRLGLLLSDVGRKAEVRVEPQELQQAVIQEAMKYRGQEREVIEFYQKNQHALEHLRAPIFEDKVVDHLFGLARVEEKPVTKEELVADPDAGDEDPGTSAGANPTAGAVPQEAAQPGNEEPSAAGGEVPEDGRPAT